MNASIINNNNTQVEHELKKLISKYNTFKKERSRTGIERLTEAEVRKDFIDPLFQILGWNIHDSSEYGAEEYIKGTGTADIILRDPAKVAEKSRSLVYIEAKRFGVLQSKTLKTKQIDLLGRFVPDWTEEDRQATNYAIAKNIRWAVLTNFEKFRLFNAKNGLLILNIEKPEEYLKRLNELKFLSKESVLSGRLEQLVEREEKKDIDLDFLDFLRSCRLLLGNAIYKENFLEEIGEKRRLNVEEIDEATQRILDRLIIIRSAEDRLILNSPNLLQDAFKHWSKYKTYSSLSEMLFGNSMIFDNFNREYNGKMFERGHICDRLTIKDNILGRIIEQLYYVCFRKFASDILGNTYEAYLGEQLTLVDGKLKLVSSRDIQKSQGIYYTPTTVVKFIVEETIRPKLEKIWQESYQFLQEKKIDEFIHSFSRIKEIKVLDPAMGSGSFIIAAFDLFVEYYKKCDNAIKESKFLSKGVDLTESLSLKELTTRIENRILTENIYGVDIDKQAAEIASLNLTLRSLKKNIRLPLILEDNIKVGNSLISTNFDKKYIVENREKIAELVKSRLHIKNQMLIKNKASTDITIQDAIISYLKEKEEITLELLDGLSIEKGGHFTNPEERQVFIWELEYPEVFFDEKGEVKSNAGFDYVLGNPPYIDIYKLSKNDPEGVEFFKNTYECAKMKFDIYILFMEKGFNLLKNNGCLSYIIPYPFIYQNYAETMRKKLLENSLIIELVDLSNIKVFHSASVKSLIFITQKTDNVTKIEENPIKISSISSSNLSDLLTEQKQINVIPQKFFSLMPNNMLRIETTKKDIQLWETIEKNTLQFEDIFYVNWGLRTGDAKRTKELITKEQTSSISRPMLRGENITGPFQYSFSNQYIIYDKDKLHNPLSEEAFENPKILIKKISGKKGIVSVVEAEKYYCYNTIIICLPYPILKGSKLLKKEAVKYSEKNILPIQDLFYISAILNSTLMNYYYMTKLSDKLSMVPGHAQQLPIKKIDLEKEKDRALYDQIILLSKNLHILNKHLQELRNCFTVVCEHFKFNSLKPLRAYIQPERLSQLSDCTYNIDFLQTRFIDKKKSSDKIQDIGIYSFGLELVIVGREENKKKYENIYKLVFTDEMMSSFFEFAISKYIEENKKKKYWTRQHLDEVLDEIHIIRSVENKEIDMKNIVDMMKFMRESFMKNVKPELEELNVDELSLSSLQKAINTTTESLNSCIYDLYGISEEFLEYVESKKSL